MKFLEISELDAVQQLLNFETEDCRVYGKCELYTTKAVGEDRKLYKSIDKHLEQKCLEDANLSKSCSPPSVAMINPHMSSPFGSLELPSSRKRFAFLVATLNASYPDYDFSTLKPQNFIHEPNLISVLTKIANVVNPCSRDRFRCSQIWDRLDPFIRWSECSIYSLDTDNEAMEWSAGTIWSLSYFFFNPNLKRVLYFQVSARRMASPAQRYVLKFTSLNGDHQLDYDLSDAESSNAPASERTTSTYPTGRRKSINQVSSSSESDAETGIWDEELEMD